MSVQAVSQHLQVLERAGLVTRGRTAQLRPSRLRGAPLKDATEWLERYRRFWDVGFDRMEERLTAGFTVTRVFDAPRERVWREWTEPEAFADWFGGPGSEVPLESVAMDVRPGGAWRATMYAGGREIHWRGEYREVDEPERLVLTMRDRPGDAYELVIVELADLGDGRTEMRFRQRGGMRPEDYERAKTGWGGFFDRIAERLG